MTCGNFSFPCLSNLKRVHRKLVHTLRIHICYPLHICYALTFCSTSCKLVKRVSTLYHELNNSLVSTVTGQNEGLELLLSRAVRNVGTIVYQISTIRSSLFSIAMASSRLRFHACLSHRLYAVIIALVYSALSISIYPGKSAF